MLTFIRHPLTTLIGGVLAAFLAVWGYGKLRDNRTANEAEWAAQLKTVKDSVKLFRDSANKRLIEYDTVQKPIYIKGRDVVLANPNTPQSTREAYKACDIILSACDSAKAALKGQVRSLEQQVNLLEHKPKPPRFQAYGEALYDPINQRPVFDVGATGKLLGPIHAAGRVEYAIPSAVKSTSGDGLRVLAGLRVNF